MEIADQLQIAFKKSHTAKARSLAASVLGSLPKKPKRKWTGWINGEHFWQWRKVILPDGRIGRVYGCVRGQVIVRVDDPHSIIGCKDEIYAARDLRAFKMPAAVELGRAKRGVRERPSALKAITSWLNGCMPPRPGSRRRGRPRKSEGGV